MSLLSLHKYMLSCLLTGAFIIFTPFAYANGEERIGPHSFNPVVKKAIPAVVFIKSQTCPNQEAEKAPANPNDPFEFFNDRFRRFFDNPGPRMSSGSGFIVSADGYVMTNRHVVNDMDDLTVILNSGEEYKAKLIGTDARTDLAIIKIDGKNLPFLKLGNSDNIEIGEWVLAIGSPFSLQATVTHGIISAEKRQNLRINDLEEFIQTDAPINPGNSGGPLINMKSEVIGINAAIISPSGANTGIGFAISSNMAKNVMNQLIDCGSIKRGYLGIGLQEIDKEIAEAYHLEKTEGVLVTEVQKDSGAEKVGIKEGDVILESNGHPIKSMGQFRNEISLLEPKSFVELTILRDGKKQKFKVELGVHPQESISCNQANQTGFEVADVKSMNPDLLRKLGTGDLKEGIIITTVKYNSLAARAGIRPGMQILQANQKPIKTVDDFQAALEASKTSKTLTLLVRFANVNRIVIIKLS